MQAERKRLFPKDLQLRGSGTTLKETVAAVSLPAALRNPRPVGLGVHSTTRPASRYSPCGLWKPSGPGAPVQSVAKRSAERCGNRDNLPGSRSVRGPCKQRQCLDLLTGPSTSERPQVTGKAPLPLASEGGASPGAGPPQKQGRLCGVWDRRNPSSHPARRIMDARAQASSHVSCCTYRGLL